MNLDVNHIDDKNNYVISLDIDTAIYSYRLCLNGRAYHKAFPKGSVRSEVVREVKRLFKKGEQ